MTTNDLIAQGSLGEKQGILDNPDLLIDSASSLNTAVNSAIANVGSAILGRINFKVKKESTIILADGTKRYSGTVKVQSGQTKSGKPQYKTIYNKFVVVEIYAVNEKGAEIKIETVNIGLLDYGAFNPGDSVLEISAGNIKSAISASVNLPAGQTEAKKTVPVSTQEKPTTNAATLPGTDIKLTGAINYLLKPEKQINYTQQEYIDAIKKALPTYNDANAAQLIQNLNRYLSQYGSVQEAFRNKIGIDLVPFLPVTVT